MLNRFKVGTLRSTGYFLVLICILIVVIEILKLVIPRISNTNKQSSTLLYTVHLYKLLLSLYLFSIKKLIHKLSQFFHVNQTFWLLGAIKEHEVNKKGHGVRVHGSFSGVSHSIQTSHCCFSWAIYFKQGAIW